MNKKPCLLFLHGWMQNGHSFDSVINVLKDNFDCYAPDLPGFGNEPRPPEAWTPADYAVWVGEYINKKNLENVTIVGHSFGGRIAIECGANNSKFKILNLKLILYGTPGYRPPISKTTTIAQALSKALKHAGIPVHKIPGISSIKSRLESKDSIDAQSIRDIFIATIEYNLEPAMQQISSPTLLLWGEKDTEVPLVIAKAMHDTIKNSQLEIMPHVTHFAHLENPSLFSGIIRQFAKSPLPQ